MRAAFVFSRKICPDAASSLYQIWKGKRGVVSDFFCTRDRFCSSSNCFTSFYTRAYREIKRKRSLNAVSLLTCWSLNIQACFWGSYLQSKTPFWALNSTNIYPKNPRWGKTARKNLSTNWNNNDQVFRVFTIYLEIFEIKKSDSITGSWDRKVARPSDERYWSKTCWGVYSRPRASSLRKYTLSATNDYTNKIIYQARNTFLSHRWADYKFPSSKILTHDAYFSLYGKKKPLEYVSRGYGKMILLL